MKRYGHIAIAVPMMAEWENLAGLLQCLREQSFRNFRLYACVNQPDEWWQQPEDSWEHGVCRENARLLDALYAIEDMDVVVLDCSSLGRGWKGKRKGVGWARKTLLESIGGQCDDNELIVSMDADTRFSPRYLETLVSQVNSQPSVSAFCLPYQHTLVGDESDRRAILRYECYMRHYLINLLEIDNPYAFSALGSAMAFPLWAYWRVGGITPLQGGEDFYLMQKFAKTGRLSLLWEEPLVVYPQGRRSARVPFGTGPAVALGVEAMDCRYPFYAAEAFREVRDTYALFPALFDSDCRTPMDDFLREQLGTNDLWSPLRHNFKRRELFVHACAERVDGLRILQYLRSRPYPQDVPTIEGHPVDFVADPLELLIALQEVLFQREMDLRREHAANRQ